jgi:hypothetical protein
LTSSLAGGEWSASRPGRFTPYSHSIRGWVDPRVGLEDMKTSKFLTLPGLELRPLGRPARCQSLYPLSYPGFYEDKTVKYLYSSSASETTGLVTQCSVVPVLLVSFPTIDLFYLQNIVDISNEGLHNLYSSPNIIRMIKSRTMRWTGHVARMGRISYKILVRKLKGKKNTRKNTT